MKNNKKLLALLLCSTIVSMTFGSETPQLSYWQRFKNWISGTSSQAQEMAKIPYAWAQNVAAGLTKEQKIALGLALGTLTIGVSGELKKGKVTPEGVGVALSAGLAGGATALYVGPYINKYLDEKNYRSAVSRMEKDLENTQQFPTIQSKVDVLEAMQAAYAPTGNKPNKISYRAARTLLYYYMDLKEQEGMSTEEIERHNNKSDAFATIFLNLNEKTSANSRIKALEKMKISFPSTGKKPTEVELEAINEIIDMLKNQK